MSVEAAASGDAYLPSARWGLGEVAWVVLAGIVGAIAGGILAGTAGFDTGDPVGVFGIVFPAQVLGSMLAAWGFSRRRGTGDWVEDFGLRLELRHAWGLLAGVGLQMAALFVTGLVVVIVGEEAAPQQDVTQLAEASAGGGVILAFLSTVVLAPLVEELIYRGMLLSRLARSMGRHRAVLAAGAVFAVVHLVDPETLLLQPGLFLIGTVLGYAALRSGNLSLPLFLHAGVNLTGFVLQRFAGDLQRFADELEGSLETILHLIIG